MKNASQQYKELYEQMCQLCASEGWGDPFSYARGKEIYMANAFNHQIWKAYSGPDGVDEAGECEYKSTIQSRIQGTYNGISVQAYVLTGDQVLDILIPKLEKQYAKKASAKDPRLGASVSSTEIKKHGKKII